jgi:ubiquitin related modifier 1
MKLKIEFGGGLEHLFSNKRTHLIDIPLTVPQGDKQGQPVDIDYLIHWLKDHLLKERPELFIENGTLYVVYCLRVLRRLIRRADDPGFWCW